VPISFDALCQILGFFIGEPPVNSCAPVAAQCLLHIDRATGSHHIDRPDVAVTVDQEAKAKPCSVQPSHSM
jgi:hypothetical protein